MSQRDRIQSHEGDEGIQRAASHPGAPGGVLVDVAAFSIQAGPLPAPEILARYEALLPGAAERIFNRWEMQSDHRMDLERTVVRGNVARSRTGLILGSGILISFLTVGGILVGLGHDAAGATIATAAVGSILGAYVLGLNSQRAERKQKAEAAQQPPPE